MAIWLITKINNATHRVTLTHSEGHSIDVTIPPEHTTDDAAKLAWLKAQTDAQDSPLAAETQPPAIDKKSNRRLIALGIACTVIALLILLARYA